MSMVSRREFLAGLTAAGTGVYLGGTLSAEESTAKVRRGTDLVSLGRTGLQTTLLGMGTGTHGGNDQRKLGQNGLTELLRHGLERGLRYIDTADMYRMHVLVQLALEGVPRDQYFIQTKTTAKHPEVAKADIERIRRELKIDHIDSLLIHCMTKKGWPTDMRPVQDVLLEAKRKGRVRAVGVSCHGYDALVDATDAEGIDVHLVRINPFGKIMDSSPEQVAAQAQKMHAKGHGVIGMKIFGETGLESREKRLESIKYVLGLGCVDAFTIGFTSTQQLDETLALIEQASA
jgi:predicted aldo/keto reductase-like oxidoreductase